MCCGQQRVEIGEAAENRIDADIIRNVVAKSAIGREDRRQPDRIDPERLQIGQPRDHAADVADPIAIGILKRARIDLVEDTVSPPEFAV